MIKIAVYFFPAFSYFFVMLADYQFWKVLSKPRKQSVYTKILFIVFWNVQPILIKWVIRL